MPDETGRFEWVARTARTVFIATEALLGLALVATVAVTVLKLLDPAENTAALPWVLAVVVELLAIFWTIVAYGVARVLVSCEFAVSTLPSRVGRLETILDGHGQSLKDLADVAPLSDNAKSLIYRDRELEALREAIHGDLIRQDYATARKLAEVIETRFSLPQEAAKLREEIKRSQEAGLEEKIDLAIQRIDELCQRQEWARALRESQRIMRLFPENPKVAALPERIRAARAQHKRDLLQAYGEAVRKNDVDAGVDLLKQLDAYLTPQEAAALEESARGVFKARLHNLGVQFAICVADQRWRDAIQAGKVLCQEFPNSRFAQEVREKLGQLEQYAEAAEKRRLEKAERAQARQSK